MGEGSCGILPDIPEAWRVMRMAARRGGRQRGNLANLIAPMIIGVAFIFMSGYALNEAFGTYWPPELLGLWDTLDDPGDQLWIILFSVFQLLGVLMVVTLPLTLVSRLRRRARQSGAPGSPPAPWLQRPDWAQGRAEATGDGRRGLPVLIVLLNLVLWPGAVWATGEILADDEQWKGILVLLWSFPLLVGVLLVGAIRRTWRRVRFGTSVFELDTLPGKVGGYLAGRLRTRIRSEHAPEDGFAVHLTCYRRVVTRDGSGSRSTDHQIQYRDEQRIRGVPDSETGDLQVPVVFEIPPDAPSTTGGGSISHVWFLEVRAKVPGVDYDTKIPVPVFEVPESDTERSSRADPPPLPAFLAYREHRIDTPVAGAEARGEIEAPSTPGVRVVLDAAGGLKELRIGARAGLAFGVTLLLSGLLFLGVVPVARLAGDAPFWVIPVCLLSGVILVGVGIQKLTSSTSLRVDSGFFTLRKGPLGLGPTTTIPFPRLKDATAGASGGQIGSRAVYRISLIPQVGDPIHVTDLLRSHAEAHWLAGLIRHRILERRNDGASRDGAETVVPLGSEGDP